MKGTPASLASIRRWFHSVQRRRSSARPSAWPSAWPSARPSARPSAFCRSMRGLRNFLLRYWAVTTADPPNVSMRLTAIIAYMTMKGATGAALCATAIAVWRRLVWFPFETSSQATSAVQPIVITKIRARHHGSHLRATLRGDSRTSVSSLYFSFSILTAPRPGPAFESAPPPGGRL